MHFLFSDLVKLDAIDFEVDNLNNLGSSSSVDILNKLLRREKDQGIKPDHDIDVFMKVQHR